MKEGEVTFSRRQVLEGCIFLYYTGLAMHNCNPTLNRIRVEFKASP